ncbi:hypothetical protein [Mycolicibacterium hodleri]|uniref:hypothetical protein n=1 Tax=Mycolicibacterium hodleri TaxID=49897 RepID=UPI001375F000|nr:hypothetical protein [Mycolicibacterium hodleri]
MAISADLAETHHHDAGPRPEIPARTVLYTSGDLLRALAAPLADIVLAAVSHAAERR